VLSCLPAGRFVTFFAQARKWIVRRSDQQQRGSIISSYQPDAGTPIFPLILNMMLFYSSLHLHFLILKTNPSHEK